MELSASVIVCTRNRCQDIVVCLDSVAKQIKQPNQLIVVDSSDIPLTKQSLFASIFNKNNFPITELIYIYSSPGLTRQRNKGITYAQGDIIYFFDDDVILSQKYLYEMQMIFHTFPQYVAGMGDISNLEQYVSSWYTWFRWFFLLPRERDGGFFTLSGMPTHPYGTAVLKNIEVLGGCCMAFRREILTQISFDETLYGYGYLEDADIARRISMHNAIFFNPAATLKHMISPIARDKMADNYSMFVVNYSYLFFKNFYRYNRLKIIAYIWSLLGLFLQGILWRNKYQVYGFFKGLIHCIKRRKNHENMV